MAYLVTARKWRPNRFEDVVGQEHITTTLKNAIRNNRLAHAYLFAGPRGVGKTTTARILAKTLNCLHPVDFEPCNECEMCKSFNTSQSLDIIEIDGASNRRIEEIRTLRDSVKYAPTKGSYKVYIIDEVHMLTNESFNALLKTLEEPPEHTIFIFATTDVHKVPLTIISRCQRFDFRRIELETIKSLLRSIAESEKIEIDDQSLTIIAKKADGALRDAESLFDQIVSFSDNKVEAATVNRMLNLVDEEVYFQISDAILSKTFISAFDITKKIYDNGWNFVDFLNGLIEHFRNIMTVRLTAGSKLIEASESTRAKYLKYKDNYSESDLLRILNYLNRTFQELKQTSNHRLKIEVALCHLIGLESSASIREVLDNLEEIKKKTPLISSNSGILTQNTNNNNGSNSYSQINTASSTNQDASQLNKQVPFPKESTSNLQGTDFQLIKDKWDVFLEEVSGEKFIAASALKETKILGLEGNKLYAEIEDPYLKSTMNQNKDYFATKTEEIFGKSLYFTFEDYSSNSPSSTPSYDDTEEEQIMEVEKVEDSNPVVRAIVNELGGEEII
ncbi:MAG: DNA polymerase III subunit gamma/tau [Bacteroidota bacterium]|nr:DNA polymerase III subunit gamma/tau [Bacteroidota bacterium]